MTQTPSTSPSRAIAEKPRLAVLATGEVASHPTDATAAGLAGMPAGAHEEAVRQQAYALYLARDCGDGHALDDWLQAEALLAGSPPQAQAPTTAAAPGH